MAKNTKKIRIEEYDVSNNQFKITFQLSKHDAPLKFAAIYHSGFNVTLTDEAHFILDFLGISEAVQNTIVGEIHYWIDQSRKHLGGHSHAHTMGSRFDVEELVKADLGGKAEAERIVVASPPLDFALTAPDEREGSVALVRSLEKLSDDPEWTAPLASELSGGGGSVVVRVPETFSALMCAKIKAMESAGLGERDLRDTRFEETRNAVRLLWAHHNGEYDGLTDRQIAEGTETIRKLTGDQSVKPWFSSPFEGWGQQSSTPTLPTAAIDKAVDEIHIHMIRFLDSKMSMREHNFVRGLIEEEIEKVVRGVL
ncbi:hypothetical protein [Rhizobium leguminosarum]|uniref:hypothetical protein n=1 Tax=Rhizobium leguminosarum TaxID=384 RepID=UPI003F98A5D6